MTFNEFVDLCRTCICLSPNGHGGYEHHKMLVDDDAQDDDVFVYDDTDGMEWDKDCEITIEDNVVIISQGVERKYIFAKRVELPTT
jgi:hypothetical protein